MRRRAIKVAAGILATAILAAGAVKEDDNRIRVRLYDYSQAPAAGLTQAKASAEAILSAAGVEVAWLDSVCRESDCGEARESADLSVRILTPEMAARAEQSKGCLGYAILPAGSPAKSASVFLHRVAALEERGRASRWTILGTTIAHEIGHLLMGSSAHSAQGVMRASWGGEDLLAMARGVLVFRGDEAARLTAAVHSRRNSR